jgi:hypothetical protein
MPSRIPVSFDARTPNLDILTQSIAGRFTAMALLAVTDSVL